MLYAQKFNYVTQVYVMLGCEKVGYVRVSTQDQNADNQKNILLEAGIPADCIFIDHGVSGTVPARKRTGFKKVLTHIKENEGVKYLFVYELSRLGRTTYETISIIQELEEAGITVWSQIGRASCRERV